MEHVLLWTPVTFIHRLAPTPLLMVTGVDDQVHAIDEFGLSIEPGLGQSMSLAAEFFDQHLRRAPRFVPSPARRGTVTRPAAGVPEGVVTEPSHTAHQRTRRLQ